MTFNGNSLCGPSGTSLCSEVFNTSFLWDNTTGTVVAGSLQFSAVGPLGTWGVNFGPSLDTFFNVVSFTAEGSFLDSFGFNLDLSPQNLITPGTYPMEVVFTPGGMTTSMTCEGDPCITDFFPSIISPPPSPPVLIGASSGSATVTAVPEPPSAVLLASGLLGLMGMGLYKKRLA